MERQGIATEHAPAAIGPYSQAVRVEDWIDVGPDPPGSSATGQLVEGAVDEQTRRVFANLSAILEAAGSSLAGVVRTTVFLASIDDFAAVNGVYGQFFHEPYPGPALHDPGRRAAARRARRDRRDRPRGVLSQRFCSTPMYSRQARPELAQAVVVAARAAGASSPRPMKL